MPLKMQAQFGFELCGAAAWTAPGACCAMPLAAYNAGPKAVEKHGGVPPFAETLNYIRRVEREWKKAG